MEYGIQNTELLLTMLNTFGVRGGAGLVVSGLVI